MKKVLLLFALLIGALSASAVEVTYDFTPNTNGDEWPNSNVTTETSYTSTSHPELTFTFYYSWWQKNSTNSYIATKKDAKEAYVKISPFKNKVVKSVTLYLPNGVTTKSAFALYIDGNDTQLGEFKWSNAGTNSNKVTIPEELQSSDNVLVIKTTNLGNQCGFGKLIIEVEDATQPTDPVDPVDPDEPVQPSAPVFTVDDEVLSGDEVELPYGTEITISAENATSLVVDVNDEVTTFEGNSTTVTVTEDAIISVIAKNGELSTDEAMIMVTVATPELTVKVGETVAEDNGEYTIEQGTAIKVTATNAQSITILDKDGEEVTLEKNCFYPMEDNEYIIEASAGEKSVLISIKVTVRAAEYINMTATYDFTTEGAYGLTTTNDSKEYETTVKDINVNDVNLHFNEGKYRLWSANSGYELRVYDDISFTISVPSNCYITKITTGVSLTATIASDEPKTANSFTYEASSNVKAVTFTTTGSPKIKTITVSYTKDNYSAEGSITLAANYEYEKGKANVLTFNKPTIKFNGSPIEDGYGEYTVLLNGVELGQADQPISYFAPENGADNKFQLRKGTKVIDVDVTWPAINAKPAIKGVRYVQNEETIDAIYNIAPEDETPSFSWLINVSNEGAELGWIENVATCTFKNVGEEAADAPAEIEAALVIPFAVKKSADGIVPLAEVDEEYEVVEYTAPSAALSTTEFAKNESNTEVSGVADVAVDQNAAAEYYNLQGVRVNGDLTPGLYIRRQGNQATKVVVR